MNAPPENANTAGGERRRETPRVGAMISDQFKADLLARVDLVSVISPHVQLKKTGDRHYGLCPFHEEKTASFAVHVDKRFYFCFGCQASGDAIGFLMNYHGMRYSDAVKQLAASVGMQIPKDGKPVARYVVQRRIDAESMLEMMEPELLIAAIASSDYAKGLQVPVTDRQRFLEAISRITNAIEFVKKRRLFDYERQQIAVEGREAA
jgi:DNA primase